MNDELVGILKKAAVSSFNCYLGICLEEPCNTPEGVRIDGLRTDSRYQGPPEYEVAILTTERRQILSC